MATHGVPLQIQTTLIDGGTGALVPPVTWLLDSEARKSLESARAYTATTVGWPSRYDVAWTVRALDDRVLPILRGPSLFETFSLSLLSLVADCDDPDLRGPCLDEIRVVGRMPLNHVAASAAFDAKQGVLSHVGAMKEKLTGLATAGPGVCAVCIVASEQDLELPHAFDPSSGCEAVATPAGPQLVLPAVHPIDAFRRLFALWARMVAREI
jgi:hypothetical protein